MYNEFSDRAEFYVVYIAEAHPDDEWQAKSNLQDGVILRQHRSFTERRAAASSCAPALGLRIPMLVDGMDAAASKAFAAWPERTYILDHDRVASLKAALVSSATIIDGINAILGRAG